MSSNKYTLIYQTSKKNIKYCGARYTPNLNEEFPNIEIESLVRTFDAFCYLPSYFEKIKKAQEEYIAELKYNSDLQKIFRTLKKKPQGLVESVNLPNEYTSIEEIDIFVKTHKKYINFIRKKIYQYQQGLFSEESNANKSKSAGDIETKRYRIRQVISKLNVLYDLVHDEPFGDVDKNILLLVGEWGSGKTHFLCDYYLRILDQKKLCLFSISGQIKPLSSPLESLVAEFSDKRDLKNFLKDLNSEGEKLNYRVPIIVDAINEGDISWWQANLIKIAKELSLYPNLCLIISCRTPFEKKVLSKRSQSKVISKLHPEFDDIEFDAQKEFFNYYNIPHFNFPLLSEEFRKPLFLKIFCESASKWPSKFEDITSGQKSMTHMLELYTVARTEDLLEKVGVASPYTKGSKIIWNFYKGGKKHSGLAPLMASLGTDSLGSEEVYPLVESYFSIGRTEAEELIKNLVQYGLLVDDYIYDWKSNKYIDVYKFPYQKFSDHLIARYLLDEYLNTTSIDAIRRSFYSNKPLGKIFNIDDSSYSNEYQSPNIAEALILEFPERVKKKNFIKNKELIFYIPKSKALISPSYRLILDGMEWRDKSSFCIGTDKIISRLLVSDSKYQREAYNTLLSLATRTNHPYSVKPPIYGPVLKLVFNAQFEDMVNVVA